MLERLRNTFTPFATRAAEPMPKDAVPNENRRSVPLEIALSILRPTNTSKFFFGGLLAAAIYNDPTLLSRAAGYVAASMSATASAIAYAPIYLLSSPAETISTTVQKTADAIQLATSTNITATQLANVAIQANATATSAIAENATAAGLVETAIKVGTTSIACIADNADSIASLTSTAIQANATAARAIIKNATAAAAANVAFQVATAAKDHASSLISKVAVTTTTATKEAAAASAAAATANLTATIALTANATASAAAVAANLTAAAAIKANETATELTAAAAKAAIKANATAAVIAATKATALKAALVANATSAKFAEVTQGLSTALIDFKNATVAAAADHGNSTLVTKVKKLVTPVLTAVTAADNLKTTSIFDRISRVGSFIAPQGFQKFLPFGITAAFAGAAIDTVENIPSDRVKKIADSVTNVGLLGTASYAAYLLLPQDAATIIPTALKTSRAWQWFGSYLTISSLGDSERVMTALLAGAAATALTKKGLSYIPGAKERLDSFENIMGSSKEKAFYFKWIAGTVGIINALVLKEYLGSFKSANSTSSFGLAAKTISLIALGAIPAAVHYATNANNLPERGKDKASLDDRLKTLEKNLQHKFPDLETKTRAELHNNYKSLINRIKENPSLIKNTNQQEEMYLTTRLLIPKVEKEIENLRTQLSTQILLNETDKNALINTLNQGLQNKIPLCINHPNERTSIEAQIECHKIKGEIEVIRMGFNPNNTSIARKLANFIGNKLNYIESQKQALEARKKIK